MSKKFASKLWIMSESVKVLSVGAALVSVIIIYITPSPIEPKPYICNSSLPRLEGKLKVNTALSKVEKLFEGKIIGPESFACDKQGNIFTGSADGKIWSFKGDELNLIARTGIDHEDCGSFELEPDCGRPKGMKIDNEGNLVLVDAYMGLLKVDLKTKELTTLVAPNNDQLDKPLKFLNGLEVTSDGMIYFTDSSTKWDRRNYRYEVIETNAFGRLIQYDPRTKKVTTLLNDLYLANGLALSVDETYVIIAEMSVSKLTRYYISGPNKGKREVFVENLPGYPDNIKVNHAGNFLVGLGSVKYEGSSVFGPFLDIIGPYPFIKKLLVKVTPLRMFDIFLPKHAILLEINRDGTVVGSYHDPSGNTLKSIGEGFECNGNLYIGHFSLPFIGRIRSRDLYINQPKHDG